MFKAIGRHLLGVVLLLGLTGTTYLLLRPFSPRAIDNHIYAIKFIEGEYQKRYQLQGNQLTCVPQDSLLTVTCTTTFEGQLLQADVTFQNETQRFATGCQAHYADQPVHCTPSFDYEHPASSVIIRDDLGISAARFSELRQQNWWLYWQENDWFQIARRFALAIAAGMAVWHFWRIQHHRLTAASRSELWADALTVGILTTVPLYLGSGMVLHELFANTPWLWSLIPWLALLGGGLTAIWRLLALSGATLPTAVKLAASTGYGLFMFIILNFLLVGNLLFLGFID